MKRVTGTIQRAAASLIVLSLIACGQASLSPAASTLVPDTEDL